MEQHQVVPDVIDSVPSKVVNVSIFILFSVACTIFLFTIILLWFLNYFHCCKKSITSFTLLILLLPLAYTVNKIEIIYVF